MWQQHHPVFNHNSTLLSWLFLQLVPAVSVLAVATFLCTLLCLLCLFLGVRVCLLFLTHRGPCCRSSPPFCYLVLEAAKFDSFLQAVFLFLLFFFLRQSST
ncbi:unnamed protein product, partial [Discosporangium mesarthrocarpum]